MANILKQNRLFWERCFSNSGFDFKLPPKRRISEVVKRLRKYNVSKVLDLGCGFGRWSIALARAGFQVKAVDISSEAIKRLTKWANQKSLSIETKVSSAQRLVSIGEKVDAVICNSVLDHMLSSEASKSMLNLKNALKFGGIAYLSFDGLDQEDKDKHVSLEDSTRRYTEGKLKGMLWRFYSNEEIRSLCKDMEVLEFIENSNGKREVWIRKK
ncbi:MAG TPA: methyltransferase domain-containing protein [candidate division Zixibacteria bacterium]